MGESFGNLCMFATLADNDCDSEQNFTNSSGLAYSVSARLPNLQFEDATGDEGWGNEGDAKWNEPGLGDNWKTSTEKPVAIPDDQIASVDPRLLRRDQLIWIVGRAATLQIISNHFWRGIKEAIDALGASQLTPSEVCRLVQAFAYAPRKALLDGPQLQRLMKAFALRAEEYSDERLARVIYGYGKLAAKRGISLQKFLDFASSEVLERSIKLRGWPSFRILKSVWYLEGANEELRTALVGQAMRRVDSLDLESLRLFVPMLVEVRFHQRPGVISRLNTVFKRKLHTYRTPDLLLQAGLTLLLYDVLKATTVALWFRRLEELRLPLTPGGAEIWQAEAGRTLGPLADAGRDAKNLAALKLAELCLRHERGALRAALPPQVLRLLGAARSTPLEPPEGLELPELPHALGELVRLARRAGLLLHPFLWGPYLLELADPLGRVVVEWDSSWTLYPPWRRAEHREFVRRKHVHLIAEGWRVVCVPLLEFQALGHPEEKLAYFHAFIKKQGLEHLRLTA